jgi:hypothetical protein
MKLFKSNYGLVMTIVDISIQVILLVALLVAVIMLFTSGTISR